MNIQQLTAALDCEGIDPRFISLSGAVQDESYVLEQDPKAGWWVYYSERGERSGERFFATESGACDYLHDRLVQNPATRRRYSPPA